MTVRQTNVLPFIAIVGSFENRLLIILIAEHIASDIVGIDMLQTLQPLMMQNRQGYFILFMASSHFYSSRFIHWCFFPSFSQNISVIKIGMQHFKSHPDFNYIRLIFTSLPRSLRPERGHRSYPAVRRGSGRDPAVRLPAAVR